MTAGSSEQQASERAQRRMNSYIEIGSIGADSRVGCMCTYVGVGCNKQGIKQRSRKQPPVVTLPKRRAFNL